MEFGVFGDLGLEEDGGFGGVEAGGQEIDGDLEGVFGDGGGVGVVAGEGVPVGYEVETFVVGIGLELDPVLEGAEVVADVQTSGGAHAGDYSIGHVGQLDKVSMGVWIFVMLKGNQRSVIRKQESGAMDRLGS